MSVSIAIKTLCQIDRALQQDQGATFRGWLGRVILHIGDAYRTDEDSHRSHLGASVLGQECARAIWYGFHWVTKKKFEGRMVRLFNRGHLEEARFIALLLMIGCEIYQQDEHGKQFRISFSFGHGGGSGDGVALKVPDLPVDTAALCEFKTHGEKSFIELAGKLDDWRKHIRGEGPFTGKGVKQAKFEHYVQMQTYMRKMGLAAALYVAVNKNTDDVYAEIVFLDTTLADQYLDRGDKIIWMDEPPKKINPSSGFFKCRWCDHRPVCHLDAKPDLNCRSCMNSEPVEGEGGVWICKASGEPIPKEVQLKGCDLYATNRLIYQ